MKRLFLALSFFLLASVVPAALAALDDDGGGNSDRPADLEKRIKSRLSGYGVSAGPAAWRSLGPGTAEVLRKIFLDPKELLHRRLGALEALGAFSEEGATLTLLRLTAENINSPLSMRRAAVRGLGLAGDEAAVRRVEGFLADRDPAVRRAAASVLSQASAARAAAEALRKAAAVEKDEAVLGSLRRALRKARSGTGERR